MQRTVHWSMCTCALVHSYCRSRSGPAITGLSSDDEGKTELCPADNRTNNNGGSESAKDKVGNEKVRWGEGGEGGDQTRASLSSITQDNIGGHPAIKS